MGWMNVVGLAIFLLPLMWMYFGVQKERGMGMAVKVVLLFIFACVIMDFGWGLFTGDLILTITISEPFSVPKMIQ